MDGTAILHVEHGRADRVPVAHPEAEALLALGRAAIRGEAAALLDLASNLDGQFAAAAALVVAARGLVVVSGVGKSWLVGARLSATLSATGTPSAKLHPTEAMHGDLGRLKLGDVLLVLSNSGETAEVLALLGAARAAVPGLAVVAVTGSSKSSVARAADVAMSVVSCGKCALSASLRPRAPSIWRRWETPWRSL